MSCIKRTQSSCQGSETLARHKNQYVQSNEPKLDRFVGHEAVSREWRSVDFARSDDEAARDPQWTIMTPAMWDRALATDRCRYLPPLLMKMFPRPTEFSGAGIQVPDGLIAAGPPHGNLFPSSLGQHASNSAQARQQIRWSTAWMWQRSCRRSLTSMFEQ